MATSAARLAAVMLPAAPPKRSRRARAHFDEHQRRAVARDEVDLAEAAAVVALDDRESLRAARKAAARSSAARRGGSSAARARIDELAVVELRGASGRARTGGRAPSAEAAGDAVERGVGLAGEQLLRDAERVDAERVEAVELDGVADSAGADRPSPPGDRAAAATACRGSARR